ncbi:MAG: LysR family transcriptional regulator [Eubacteriales bacterium]|nr:LysR family transcriptional regulator [Eubacteriales bacterium]
MKKNLTYNITVRLFSDEKSFGPGIAKLLHQVEQLHSLRAAAQSMNMAYSKAWTIVKNSERALGFPLLHSVTGGKNGGGAELTTEAVNMLNTYDEFCAQLQAYGDQLFVEMFL